MLYLKSDLTCAFRPSPSACVSRGEMRSCRGGEWRIYADNLAMARWLQRTIQGVLNEETADTTIPVIDAVFTKSGDPAYFWVRPHRSVTLPRAVPEPRWMFVRVQTETIETEAEKIAMTWSDIGDPIILHNRAPPGSPVGGAELRL